MDGYVRVSRASAQRRASDGYHSKEIQRSSILRWAEQHDVEIGVVLEDENVSGNKRVADRQLEDLIKRVEAGISQGVVVYNVKRFGRNQLESCVAVARVREYEGRIVSVEDGADTERSMLHFDIMTAIGAEELRARRQGWADAVDAAVASGKHVACRAPRGYLRLDQADPQRDGEGRLIRNARLVIDPVWEPKVRKAFEMRAAGSPQLEIAREVGLTTSTVSSMLGNRVYLGEARGPGGATNPKAHEPIVDDVLFAAVQARKGSRIARQSPWVTQPMLTGLVLCAECGGKMQIVAKSYKGRRVPSYVCMSKSHGKSCSGCAVGVERLDDYVTSLIDLDDPGVGDAFHGLEQAWLAAKHRVAEADAELEQFVDTAFGLRRDLFSRGLEARQAAVNEAKSALYELKDPGIDPDTLRTINLGPEFGIAQFQARGDDPARDRMRMRRIIRSITVTKSEAGRLRWQPVDERVKIDWKVQPSGAAS